MKLKKHNFNNSSSFRDIMLINHLQKKENVVHVLHSTRDIQHNNLDITMNATVSTVAFIVI